ncbi:hypothetical protein HSX11_08655 [Oxalobacteraceae bacterium]|nr:hypothetical protein [Oxalobacteraceae bacterium]
MQSTLKTRLEALWMVPLGLASFVIFRTARAILARLIERQTFRQHSYKPGWRPMSGAMLQVKWYLPWIMTRAPRWNPHALIANAGPFTANQRVRVRLADADASAGDWTIVLYTHPHYKTLNVLAPTPGAHGEWIDIKVEPGQYTLSLRYYHLGAAPSAPAIEIDGKAFCPSQALDRHTNDFYRTLAQRSNLFYRALQYYVAALLRFERSVKPQLLRRELLPVGNPNTHFVYGYHRAGQRIRVDLDPAVFAHCHSYLTIYDRASFPLAWHDLDSPSFHSAVAVRPGYYLLRLCVKPGHSLPSLPAGARAQAEYVLQSCAEEAENRVMQ